MEKDGGRPRGRKKGGKEEEPGDVENMTAGRVKEIT